MQSLLFVFAWENGRFHPIPKQCLAILDTLTIGISLGLPLYWLRQEMDEARRLEGCEIAKVGTVSRSPLEKEEDLCE